MWFTAVAVFAIVTPDPENLDRRHDLTEIEKVQINVLRRQNLTIRAIAKKINRGKSCVAVYINRNRNKGAKNRRVRSKILTERGVRAILSVVARSRIASRKVLADTKSPVPLHAMQRILDDETHLVYGTFLARHKLTSECIRQRLRWAQVYIFKTPEFWRKTVWID